MFRNVQVQTRAVTSHARGVPFLLSAPRLYTHCKCVRARIPATSKAFSCRSLSLLSTAKAKATSPHLVNVYTQLVAMM